MSTKPHYVIVANKKRQSLINFPPLFALFVISFLSACTPLVEPVIVEQPQAPAPIKKLHYSSEPIIRAEFVDVRFAQEALTQIGYKIGKVDGLWGPRSAKAIREFEFKRSLTTANGHLSELNLNELAAASGLIRTNYDELQAVTVTTEEPLGIAAKLSKKIPLSNGPQLIIVDNEYTVLSKPNPFSSEMLTLAPGTGIYVISQQDGYFEIESIGRKRGYIKID